MTKRTLLSAVLFSICLSTINAQPFAYFTALSSSSIMVMNLGTKKEAAVISTSNPPLFNINGIAITSDGARAVVAAGESLLVIDTTTYKITANIHLSNFNESNEVTVSPNGKYAYVTGPTPGVVWVVSLETNTIVSTIPVGGKPRWMTIKPDGSSVYVSHCGNFASALCVINTANNTVTTTLSIAPDGLVISPDGTRLYVLGYSISVIDTATNKIVSSIPLHSVLSMAISPDGKYLYLAEQSTTIVFDVTLNKTIATANAGGIVTVAPDGTIYVIEQLYTAILWVINPKTNSISDKIDTPQSIRSVIALNHIAITSGPQQKPIFKAGAVVNAATFQGGGIVPGEIITVFGSGIGPSTLATMALDSNGRVANTLAETRVLFDGVPAPLIYVSQAQTSAIVPYSVAGKNTTQVQIEFKGIGSDTVTLQVFASDPGLFTINSSGKDQGAILNENATVNSAGNPAIKGSVIVLYATGEGQTNPSGVDGTLANSVYPKPLLPVSVQIGGVAAEILYAGAAPGMVAGVMQVNARVPSNVSSGNISVTVAVGGKRSRADVTAAIK
jgi:uncharacterized protein (TIGR03437 family)